MTPSKGLRNHYKTVCEGPHNFGKNGMTCRVCGYQRITDPCMQDKPVVGGSLAILEAKLAEIDKVQTKKDALEIMILQIMRHYKRKVLRIADTVDIRDRVHMACITLGMSEVPIKNSKRCCADFKLRFGVTVDVSFSGEWILPRLAERVFRFRIKMP